MTGELDQTIIDFLKVNHDFNSSSKISQKLNISRKTVIRRIDQLNNSFPEKIIISKRGMGFKLIYKNYLKYESEKNTSFSSMNSRQENILSRLLLSSPKAISLSKLTNSVFVSESVIQNDERVISKQIRKWNLTLVRKQRLLSIAGTEADIRNAIIEVVLHVNNTTEISNLKNSVGYFNQHDFNFALEQVKIAMKALNSSLPYPYNINFLTHIYILLNRVRTFRLVNYSDSTKLNIKKESKQNPYIFKICQKIINNIGIYLNVKPKTLLAETYYLFEYLISSRFIKNNIPISNQSLVDQVSQEYVEIVSKVLQTTFNKKIKNDIKNHISSMIMRLKMHVFLPNALLNDIKLEYGKIYSATLFASNEIEEKFKLPHISDSETGFICLYFVKYFEEKPKQEKRIRVYIICTTGIGTSEIISAKIKKLMPEIKIIGLGSSLKVDEILKKHKNIDLILSTVPIKIKTTIPIELVSAFLTKEDEKNVREAIRKIK